MTSMKRSNQGSRGDETGFIKLAPYFIYVMMAAFVIAAIVFGELLDAYDAFWWWDDMLHGVSGVLFAFIGLGVLYGMNRHRELRLSPQTTAVFVACFALSMGVAWEIYEFVMDVTIKATMQQWNMGPNAIVMGKDYQGMGLRDTMSDLIMATIGALITAVFTFVACWRNEPLVRRIMRMSFPLIAKK